MKRFLMRWLWRRGVLGRFLVIGYVVRFLVRLLGAGRPQAPAPQKDRTYDYEVKR